MTKIETGSEPAKDMAEQIEDLQNLPQIALLQDLGALFYDKGWSLGTSSNYSVVMGRNPLRLLITASGKDKRKLLKNDFLLVDSQGKSVADNQPKPSSETLLHVVAAQYADAGAVLHTHSVWSTLLSDRYQADGGFDIQGYEMLKGLCGINTHKESFRVEVFDNTQDIAYLAGRIQVRLQDKDRPLKCGYLIARHGLYTWGKDLDEARRHVEIFEFLFEVHARGLGFDARR